MKARGAELPCEEASPSWTALSARLLVNRSSPRRMVKPAMVNRSAPDLFPAACILKRWFSSAQGEQPRAFGLDAGRILQPLENEVIFIVKELPIK